MSHVDTFFQHVVRIATGIDRDAIERLAQELRSLRERGGRLFILGVGGSAGNSSHAVNDFRKLCGIEAYAPIDNVSELTARTNDEGWETIFAGWLTCSRAERQGRYPRVLGRRRQRGAQCQSMNSSAPSTWRRSAALKVFGIVGRDGGYTAKHGDVASSCPTVDPAVTPHAEAFQAVVWHCLVSHPAVQIRKTKW